jgi:hypothetical protein
LFATIIIESTFMQVVRRLNQKTLAGLGLVASVLTACGGGGGGGSTLPPYQRPTVASASAELTALNFDDVGVPAVHAVQNAGTSRDNLALAPGAVANAATSPIPPAAKTAMSALKTAQLDATLQGKTNSATVACPGGGAVDVAADDADNSQSVSTGDTASITLRNCITDGSPPVNGALTFRFVSVSTQSCGTLMCGIYDVTFFNLGTGPGLQVNGNVRLDVSPTTLAVAYNGFNDGPSIMDMDVVLNSSSASNTFTMNGFLTVNAQTYRLDTRQTFVGHTQAPNAGQLRVTDAKGNFVDVTSKGAAVDVDYFTKGATTAVASKKARSWSSF